MFIENKKLFLRSQSPFWAKKFDCCGVEARTIAQLQKSLENACNQQANVVEVFLQNMDFNILDSTLSSLDEDYSRSLSQRYPFAEQWLTNHKVGVVLLAAGQSTRLGLMGPKGLFPASSVRGCSLFDLFCAKHAFLEKAFSVNIPLAVLCQDPCAIQSYFDENDYFGLDAKNVDFFSQSELPLLGEDVDGYKAILKRDKDSVRCLKGPDGNGAVFAGLLRSGIWDKWLEMGIEVVASSLIDNPLMAPFSLPALNCFTESWAPFDLPNDQRVPCSAMICALPCTDPDEKVGLLGRDRVSGELSVIEYGQHHQDGNMESCLANSGAILWSARALNALFNDLSCGKEPGCTQREAALSSHLPWHFAKRRYRVEIFKERFNEGSQKSVQEEMDLFKAETFIFDWLPLLQQASKKQKVSAIVLDKKRTFYPLKNKEGAYSPKTFAAHLCQLNRLRLHDLGVERINGTLLSQLNIELAPQFDFLSNDELKSWFQAQRCEPIEFTADLCLETDMLARFGIHIAPSNKSM